MNKQKLMELVDACIFAAATGSNVKSAKIRAAIEAALPDVPEDGTLHQDGYFTWNAKKHRPYERPSQLPCKFWLAAPEPAQAEQPKNKCKLTECEGRPACATCVATGMQPASTVAQAEQPRNEPVQQEPFAWATFDGEGGYDLRLYYGNESYRDDYLFRNQPNYASWVFPLYASQQARPMSDEQAMDMAKEFSWGDADIAGNCERVRLIRAVERFHKIGG